MSNVLSKEGLTEIFKHAQVHLIDGTEPSIGLALMRACAEASGWDGDKAAITHMTTLHAIPAIARKTAALYSMSRGDPTIARSTAALDRTAGGDEDSTDTRDYIGAVVAMIKTVAETLIMDGDKAQRRLESAIEQLESADADSYIETMLIMTENMLESESFPVLAEQVREYCKLHKPF